jgi:hypothetical protein
MNILVVILLNVNLSYMYYPVEYKDCHDSGMNIIEEIAQYYNQTKDINQGYYTKDGKLVVGFYCK